jgi:hypothetical protein
MITFIIALIGAIIFWQLIARGFSLGAQATAATQRTAAILEAVLPPEKRELVREFERRQEEERQAADLSYRRKRAAVLWALIIGGFLWAAYGAHAQGIYMGRDGRVHSQVIVGADGTPFPVAPTYCPNGYGPCPVVLGQPAPPLPPQAAVPMPPPPPLGWVYSPYLSCVEPSCASLVVNVPAAEAINVRVTPNGVIALSVANGTLLLRLQQQGSWTLVAPTCQLVPTGLWSTAAVPLGACL